MHPVLGRDKSLRYIVDSRDGLVGQGFSPAEPSDLRILLGEHIG